MAIQKISGVTIDLDSQASGDVTYFDGAQWVRLPKGETGEVLTMNEGATAPQWAEPVFTRYGGDGVYGGAGGAGSGADEFTGVIQFVVIATVGNSVDFGDLTVARNSMAGMSSGSGGGRGVFAGSYNKTIDYITFATPGNAIDFGDLSAGRDVAELGNEVGVCDGVRGCACGGGSTSGYQIIIDYITIATPGNALDFGDLTVARYGSGDASSDTRGVVVGGHQGPGLGGSSNTMDYITIATTGNALDFGDTSVARSHLKGVDSAAGRAAFGGGYLNFDIIDYITIATPGNALDFGDLSVSRGYAGGVSNGSRGVWAGGSSGANQFKNEIDYITIATLGNATDFGDILLPALGLTGVSGD